MIGATEPVPPITLANNSSSDRTTDPNWSPQNDF
jgi:hypothetical protein